jgi:hypothetical protein
MVERAAVAHRTRRTCDPVTVHDTDPRRAEQREQREVRDLELRGSIGPIRHSAHPGRILSVR